MLLPKPSRPPRWRSPSRRPPPPRPPTPWSPPPPSRPRSPPPTARCSTAPGTARSTGSRSSAATRCRSPGSASRSSSTSRERTPAVYARAGELYRLRPRRRGTRARPARRRRRRGLGHRRPARVRAQAARSTSARPRHSRSCVAASEALSLDSRDSRFAFSRLARVEPRAVARDADRADRLTRVPGGGASPGLLRRRQPDVLRQRDLLAALPRGRAQRRRDPSLQPGAEPRRAGATADPGRGARLRLRPRQRVLLARHRDPRGDGADASSRRRASGCY